MGSKVFDDFYYNLLEKPDIPWKDRSKYNDYLFERYNRQDRYEKFRKLEQYCGSDGTYRYLSS
jgi:hypothetical protein